MGYEAMVIRFEGLQRQRSAFDAVQGFEWIWRGSDNASPKDQDIFTHCMYGNYCDFVEQGFSWDFGDVNPSVTPDNIASLAQKMLDYITAYEKHYRGGTVMIAWGCDFKFQDAASMFGNMTLLVNYVNSNTWPCLACGCSSLPLPTIWMPNTAYLI